MLSLLQKGLSGWVGWRGPGASSGGRTEWPISLERCTQAPTDAESGVFALWFAQRVLAGQNVRMMPPADFRESIRRELRWIARGEYIDM